MTRREQFRLFRISTNAPGRVVAAIYGVAKRARVNPEVVTAALLTFGLERLASALKSSREVPPVTNDVPNA